MRSGCALVAAHGSPAGRERAVHDRRRAASHCQDRPAGHTMTDGSTSGSTKSKLTERSRLRSRCGGETTTVPMVLVAWRCCVAVGLALLALAASAPASRAARGFVLADHSAPPAGATLEASPDAVRVWFEAPIVPALSAIWVENAQRERVDEGDGHVDARDRKLLEVTVPRLRAGKYRVFWSVVVATGRRSSGDFPFRVR